MSREYEAGLAAYDALDMREKSEIAAQHPRYCYAKGYVAALAVAPATAQPVAWQARPHPTGWDILGPEEPAGVPPPEQDIGIYAPRRRVIAKVFGTDDAARSVVDALTRPAAPPAPGDARPMVVGGAFVKFDKEK